MAKSFILHLHVVGKLLRTISSVAWLASEHEKQLDNIWIGRLFFLLASTFKVLYSGVYDWL